MIKIQVLLLGLLLSINLLATERYVYKARTLLTARATLVLDVERKEGIPEEFVFIKSTSKVYMLTKQIFNIHHRSINSAEDFTPRYSIECFMGPDGLNMDPLDKNCRSVHFKESGEFLYLRHHQNVTELFPISEDYPEVKLMDVRDQVPDFDPARDVVYDPGSIVLLVKQMELSPENPERLLYVSVNKTVVKVSVSFVKYLNEEDIELKVKPIYPSEDEFDVPFPHKIIYNSKIKAVTVIYQKAPVVGNVKIKLDLKRSSF